MKKSVEIIAHIFFWITFTAFVVILSQMYLQARPDSPLSKHFSYLVSLELIMALLLFYTTFLGITFARRNKIKLIILVVILLFQLAFFALPALRKGGIWEVLSSLIPHIIVIFLAIIFKRFSDSIRLEKEKQELLLQNTLSELALLKMQVSPHFLFNTLNNIDHLISIDAAKASDCVSRLGDILRYMIYDTKAEKIRLSEEITHIEDYIELIRLRTSGSNYLNYTLTGNTGYLQIAPMLFIPLIENAFKHSSKKEGENIIIIAVTIDNKSVYFKINNEYDNAPNKGLSGNEGLGLNLVKRRLELIYPQKNTFNISRDKNRYNVELRIDLDEY